MANAGPNSNGSQFFMCFIDTAWLNGKHVVFGKVSKGMELLKTIEKNPVAPGDKPIKAVMIADCGVL